jgi:hypothetical protein
VYTVKTVLSVNFVGGGVAGDQNVNVGAGIAQSVQRLATGWAVRGSNPGEGKIFRTHPDRPRDPYSLLYNEHGVSFPRLKRPGRGVFHLLPSSAAVKERAELYPYFPCGRSWPVKGELCHFAG